MSTPYAFVTLVTSDYYLPGALTVAAALKDVHPSPATDPEVPFQITCLATPETVDIQTLRHLRSAFDIVIGVEVIEEANEAGLQLLGRPDLHAALTKLHIFRLTQYNKIIFLDADVLPLRPLSHLFTLPHEFAAVPDVGWPDIFNSGVMVLSPGENKFKDIMELVKSKGSWDGADQGVLNEWRGNDWHKLSFTYNTTPTAAYTYAPAYERFGSQISVLHFIGPNKPWSSIPYRAPGSAASEHSGKLPVPLDPNGAGTQRSYDYPNMVDRWFNVYDRYYRNPAVLSEREFEVKKFENAWNHGASSFVAARTKHNLSRGTLGLEDLRRLAVEGVNTNSGASTSNGIGEYRSLPLEGRVDLMRPKNETPQSGEHPVAEPLTQRNAPVGAASGPPPGLAPVLAPTPAHPSWPVPTISPPLPPDFSTQSGAGPGSVSTHELGPNYAPEPAQAPAHPSHYKSPPVPAANAPKFTGTNPSVFHAASRPLRMETLLTPAAHEVPSAPFMGLRSLPPSMPSTPAFHQAPSGTQEARPAMIQATHHSQPSDPQNEHSTGHHSEERNERPGQQPQHHHEDHEQQAAPAEPTRPHSPPLLSWNPAIEPPPNDPPPANAFCSDAHFANVWDIPPSTARFHASMTGEARAEPQTYFEPPRPTVIPQHLILEGHYAKAMGSSATIPHEASQPTPNWSKVVPVFPWETKPRHMPARKFPGTLAPPGAVYIEPSLAPDPAAPQPETHSPFDAPPPSAPPTGFPTASSYSNVWDAVPSIQKYASKLVKPSGAPPMTPQESLHGLRKRSETFRSWVERSDATSMDGDVEDEGDEDGDEEDGRQDSKESSSGERSMGKSGRSRSGSSSGARTPSSGSSRRKAKKEYRSHGVQTAPKAMRSHGVQASPPMTGKGDDLPAQKLYASVSVGTAAKPPSRRGAKSPPLGQIDIPKFPPTIQDFRLGQEQMASASPAVVPTHSFMRPSRYTPTQTTQQMASSVLSPRMHDTYSIDSPRSLSPSHISPVTTPAATPGPPRFPMSKLSGSGPLSPSMLRTSSNETTESPPTSAGPMSPADYHPGLPPTSRKTSGRIWNPATGVDVFKRGSEKVLARFLKMGSWEEDAQSGQRV